jgi:riboflavin-specific deaminase-like protein
MQFLRLLPEYGHVEIGQLLALLNDLRGQARDDRPYIVVNFIASADGRATLEGRSGHLGDDGDRAMFHGLREQVDAVFVGTNTLAIEHYGRILGRPERRQRRLKRGLPAEPLACMITRTGRVPTGIRLFAEPEARIVVFTPSALEPAGTAARVDAVVLDPGELTLTTAMRKLRTDYGIELLLCEGGPTLFGAMLHEALVDELFVTIAPKLAGGGHGPTVTNGPELANPAELQIQWLLERDEALYLRYRLR